MRREWETCIETDVTELSATIESWRVKPHLNASLKSSIYSASL